MADKSREIQGAARDLRSIARYGRFERILTLAPLEGWEPGLKYQPYDRPNPFDRKTEEGEPLLEIVLDTQSFADQLVSGDPHDPTLTRVLQLAGFPLLRVVALPTDRCFVHQLLLGGA